MPLVLSIPQVHEHYKQLALCWIGTDRRPQHRARLVSSVKHAAGSGAGGVFDI